MRLQPRKNRKTLRQSRSPYRVSLSWKSTILIHGVGKLSTDVASTPYRVFSLFFTDEILHKLVEYTNEYAAEYASKEDKPFARKWHSTSLQQLRAYIATYIYMEIHSQSQVSDYWNRDLSKEPLHPLIYDHIALCRWQQIDRFLRISKPTSSSPTIFEKLEELSEHLRHAFKQYLSIGTHLTVDESILRFQGRSAVTANIPSKPVPEGYKLWVLANAGYVLDWLFHAKGDKLGSVDLDEFWTKDEGFSKIQAVVLDLLTQQGIDDNNKHVVWLDNLFTSARLLSVLRDLGFGAAGTVRVIKTKRDEYEEKHGTQAQKQQKEQNRELDTSQRPQIGVRSSNWMGTVVWSHFWRQKSSSICLEGSTDCAIHEYSTHRSQNRWNTTTKAC